MILEHQLIGHGPQHVVVLHGWFGNERMVDALAPALDTDAFTYACVAYRGCGVSMHLRGDYTLDEIAQDTLDTAQSLGWNRFDLVGHSMGGKAALAVALRAPQRVRHIVALTPVPANAVPFDDATWALFESAARDLGRREAIVDQSTGGRLDRTWVSRLARSSWMTSRPEAFAAYLHAWARTDFAAQLRGAPTPVLAVVGEHDASLTAQVMQGTYLADLPNAELATLANAGHYPIDEVPLITATTVQRYLRAGFLENPHD